MKGKVKETFFPDDPFRSFKGQPQRAKFVLAAKYLFPVLEWAPGYSLSLFKSDLIAGLTIASLAIPQACTTHPLSNFKILEL
jgi:sulfate transporter 3